MQVHSHDLSLASELHDPTHCKLLALELPNSVPSPTGLCAVTESLGQSLLTWVQRGDRRGQKKGGKSHSCQNSCRLSPSAAAGPGLDGSGNISCFNILSVHSQGNIMDGKVS